MESHLPPYRTAEEKARIAGRRLFHSSVVESSAQKVTRTLWGWTNNKKGYPLWLHGGRTLSPTCPENEATLWVDFPNDK